MKKDVIIEIKGAYRQAEEEDAVDFITTGSYVKKGNAYSISYEESEMTGYQGSRTTVEVEGERVVMRRTGSAKSHMIIERGVRHQCHYDTPEGYTMVIGVCGSNIVSHLNEEGGDLSFSYSLDINTFLASENHIKILVNPPQETL